MVRREPQKQGAGRRFGRSNSMWFISCGTTVCQYMSEQRSERRKQRISLCRFVALRPRFMQWAAAHSAVIDPTLLPSVLSLRLAPANRPFSSLGHLWHRCGLGMSSVVRRMPSVETPKARRARSHILPPSFCADDHEPPGASGPWAFVSEFTAPSPIWRRVRVGLGRPAMERCFSWFALLRRLALNGLERFL